MDQPEPQHRSLLRHSLILSTGAQEEERLAKMVDFSESLDRLQDLDAVLDRVLSEAVTFTNADSGTIYLTEQNSLRFAYNHQSGKLATLDLSSLKRRYLDHRMPIGEESIAGYVALHGEPVVIEDAYRLPPESPYSFNRSYDQETNYRTQSMFTVPLKSNRGDSVGVIQLVNALDDTTTRPVPFTQKNRLYVALFAKSAAVAIERTSLTRSIILRMIGMAALRDPRETGAHVNRVGSYSVEIYQRWAEKQGIDQAEIKRNRDSLRLGAMMHDVGKIAISDAILKKPGPLTDAERAVMQTHTVVGARLFAQKDSLLDVISQEIALNHHEKWDGTGYPGVGAEEAEPIRMGPGKKGEEIPLYGRIVGVADVYDALCSRRSYKEPWDEDRVLETLRQDSGSHFDPQVVEAFIDVHEVIQAIREKYSE